MPDLETQRAFYDARWTAKTYANRLQLQRAVAILSGLSSLKLQEPRILDVGCGTGWLTSILGRFGPATGVELSEAAIQRARELYPDVRFYATDISDVLASDEPYDVVVSQEVIEHLSDQAAHIDLLARVLKPGGYLLLTTPNAAYTRTHPPAHPQPIEAHLNGDQLRRLLTPRFRVHELRTIVSRRTALSRLAPSPWLERLGYGKHLFALAQLL